MYKITTDSGVTFSESLVYVTLHDNGCYVASDPETAQGVCAKAPTQYTVDREDGTTETVNTVSDTVYRLTVDGLHGTEPLATAIETVTVQEPMSAAVDGVLDELEAAINV